MSIIIDVIEQPPAVIDVLQSTATVVEVLTPGGVAAVLSPLVYNPATQTLSFDQSLLTGLPPSAVTGTAVVNADPRLTNARTPTAHKATHATGGSDALTPADIGAEPLGAAASSMSSHLAAADPHPQYTTAAEAAAAAPVQSVAGKTGTVTLTPADVGADATGTAAAAVTAHEAAADPHTQYTTAARVRAVVLTGLSTAVNAAVTAADSILSALGKLQAQLTAHVGTGGAAHAEATTSTAGFLAAADKTKLDGIAAGATANSSDAQLRDRSTHTGTQAINTVTGLQTALDGKEAVGTATNSMATHLAAADPHSQYTTAAEAAAAAPVQSVAGKTGTVTLAAADITDSTAAGRAVLTAADAAAQRTALGLVLGTDVQAYDADLQAIAALAGSSGLLRKTGANTWSLDTSSFLTGNQTVTVTGDASGSGATSIALTLANSGVAAGTYNDSATQVRPFTVDAKGRVTAVGAAVTITPAWASITGKPTTLSGYGITDAQPLDSDLTAIAALTHAADNFLVSNGSAWVRETPAEALVSLGLGTPTGTGNVVRATSPTVADPTLNGQTQLAAGTAAAPALTTIGDLDTGVFFPAANTWAVATDGSERMRIDSSGNLTFMGTAQRIIGNFSGSNTTRLYFQTSTANGSTNLSAMPDGTGTQSGFFFYAQSDLVNNSWVAVRAVSGNDVRFQSGISGTGTYLPMTFWNGGSERMRIDSSGNVGIGTTSPSGRFHIASSGDTLSIIDARTGAPNGSLAILQLWSKNAAGTNNFGRLAFDGDGNLEIGTYGSGASANEIAFFLNSQERMRIDSSGNVGIGTTTPAVRLDVAEADNPQLRVEAKTNGVDTRLSSLGLSANAGIVGTYSNHPLVVYANSQERMRITASGNVGINDSNPGYLLTLTGASNPQVWVSATNVAGNSAGIGFENQGQRNWQIWADRTTDTLSFGNNSRGTTNLVIGNTGNVGIGTTSPAVRLEVAGQIRTEAPTGGTAANWRLGTVHTVSPTSPNRTIEVDIGGTIYYLHAKTTND